MFVLSIVIDLRPMLQFTIQHTFYVKFYFFFCFLEQKAAALGRNPPGCVNRLLIVKADSDLLNGLSHVVSLAGWNTGNSLCLRQSKIILVLIMQKLL